MEGNRSNGKPYRGAILALNVWMSQHSISCNGDCGFESYPYFIQNPISRELQEITNQGDFQALVFQLAQNIPQSYSIGQQMYWNLCMHRCACPNNLYDEWSTKVMKRYVYCRDNPSTPPFEGSYDQQPAWWLDAISVLDREIIALSTCQCFKCKPASKGFANG